MDYVETIGGGGDVRYQYQTTATGHQDYDTVSHPARQDQYHETVLKTTGTQDGIEGSVLSIIPPATADDDDNTHYHENPVYLTEVAQDNGEVTYAIVLPNDHPGGSLETGEQPMYILVQDPDDEDSVYIQSDPVVNIVDTESCTSDPIQHPGYFVKESGDPVRYPADSVVSVVNPETCASDPAQEQDPGYFVKEPLDPVSYPADPYKEHMNPISKEIVVPGTNPTHHLNERMDPGSYSVYPMKDPVDPVYPVKTELVAPPINVPLNQTDIHQHYVIKGKVIVDSVKREASSENTNIPMKTASEAPIIVPHLQGGDILQQAGSIVGALSSESLLDPELIKHVRAEREQSLLNGSATTGSVHACTGAMTDLGSSNNIVAEAMRKQGLPTSSRLDEPGMLTTLESSNNVVCESIRKTSESKPRIIIRQLPSENRFREIAQTNASTCYNSGSVVVESIRKPSHPTPRIIIRHEPSGCKFTKLTHTNASHTEKDIASGVKDQMNSSIAVSQKISSPMVSPRSPPYSIREHNVDLDSSLVGRDSPPSITEEEKDAQGSSLSGAFPKITMNESNGIKPVYRCPECGMEFSRKMYMDAHHRSHGGKQEKSSDSPPSEAAFPTITTRMQNGEERYYRCQECDIGFGRKLYLEAHLRSHIRMQKECLASYKCKGCGRNFTSDGLKEHLNSSNKCRTLYNTESLVKSQILQIGDVPDTVKDLNKSHGVKRPNNTDKSDIWSDGKKLKKSKVRLKKSYRFCNKCNILYSKENEDAHKTCHDKIIPENDLEERKAPISKNSGQNVRVVTKELPHSSKVFAGASKDIDGASKDKIFKCEYCGQGFMNPACLEIHASGHTQKQFLCGICGKQFLHEFVLRVHMSIHSKSPKVDSSGEK